MCVSRWCCVALISIIYTIGNWIELSHESPKSNTFIPEDYLDCEERTIQFMRQRLNQPFCIFGLLQSSQITLKFAYKSIYKCECENESYRDGRKSNWRTKTISEKHNCLTLERISGRGLYQIRGKNREKKDIQTVVVFHLLIFFVHTHTHHMHMHTRTLLFIYILFFIYIYIP